ncbi:MAG TPA: His/Gly/Thr/Pro-type tRNA ligase C-terminal domain-containing protein, partial [Oscillospiraceae bacterium]|nr:His/Gly/Thr/Pro-type tRNA ligase C-terminal domain-containing protein [Oscillospiraceae bacterium]
EAQTEKIPYMVVVGDKEKESGTVTVRDRRDGSQTSCTLEEFIAKIRVENDNKVCS